MMMMLKCFSSWVGLETARTLELHRVRGRDLRHRLLVHVEPLPIDLSVLAAEVGAHVDGADVLVKIILE